ncbi:helix-turn-helix domain-containing protein [Pseudonocardia phyllosphaerae]|uniref:helix-turn-helix domain-containing protein n=1 Tax=Pseudonocardia phyllosphaerae TaxID=3390502 RepID=UPI00397B01D5
MTVTHGPVVIRRRLGWVLKKLRMDQGRQLGEVAKMLEVSPSKLSRIETGHVEPKFRDVRDLLEIYDADTETRERALDWAQQAKSPGWWARLGPASSGVDLNMLISLESEARTKRMFSIPIAGLLQTEAYARDLLTRVFTQREDDSEIDRMVEIRMGRQNVIEPDRADAPPLVLHVLMDEVALYRCADPTIMRGQIETLLRRREQDNVLLQIVPFRAGWTNATSTFSIFDPRDTESDWRVVNVEGTANDVFVDSEQTIADYERIWSELLELAQSPEESQETLERALAATKINGEASRGRTPRP